MKSNRISTKEKRKEKNIDKKRYKNPGPVYAV